MRMIVRSWSAIGGIARYSLCAASVILLSALPLAPGGVSPAAAAPVGAQVVLYQANEDASAGTVTTRLGIWNGLGEVERGLEVRDFVVTDSGKPATVQSVSVDSDEPLSLVLVVDNSRNWVQAGKPDVDAQRVLVQSVSAFLERLDRNTLHSPPRVALVTMNRPADLSPGSSDQLSQDLTGVHQRLDHLQMVVGDAPLRDRLSDAIHLLRNEPAGRRRVMMLLSDGNDVASPITYDQILTSAGRDNVQVFAASVAAQQAAQLEVLAQGRNGVFRDAKQASQLPGLMPQLADTVQLSYRITYAPQLREGAHHGQIALRGQPWVKFDYDSSVQAPRPQLHLNDTERSIGLLWTSVSATASPGSERAIKSVTYKVDGRPVAAGTAESTTLFLPFSFPSLNGRWMISAEVDDGLVGESNAIEYTDSVSGEATAGGLAAVGAIAVLWLAHRRLRPRGRRHTRRTVGASTPLFSLQPVAGSYGPNEPVELRKNGTVGRGTGAYGIDAANAFFSGVSRKHVEINVRDGQVLARACKSGTVGTCRVDVQAPGSMTMSPLSDKTFTTIEVGSLVFLGAQPAPGFSERPSFVLHGPPRASNDTDAQTQLGQPIASEDDDPDRTQFAEPSDHSPSSAAVAFARWLPH